MIFKRLCGMWFSRSSWKMLVQIIMKQTVPILCGSCCSEVINCESYLQMSLWTMFVQLVCVLPTQSALPTGDPYLTDACNGLPNELTECDLYAFLDLSVNTTCKKSANTSPRGDSASKQPAQ